MLDRFTFSQYKPRYYYCSKRPKGCKAKVVLNQARSEIVSMENEHDHEPPLYKLTEDGTYVKLAPITKQQPVSSDMNNSV